MKCPVCSSVEWREWLVVPDRFDAGTTYPIVRCSVCGMGRTIAKTDSDSRATAHSLEGYDPFTSVDSGDDLFRLAYRLFRRGTVRWKTNLVERYIKKGTVADVGCGTGELLAEFGRRGWETVGLEPDATAAEYANRTHGIEVRVASLDEGPDLPRADVVMMWHVLEHTVDPAAALARVRSWLVQGGYIFVAVPDPSSAESALFGPSWVAFDAPRHLWHFTRSTLSRLLRNAGYEIVVRMGMLQDSLYNTPMSVSLAARVSPVRMFAGAVSVAASCLFGSSSQLVVCRAV
jgi:2-polyprenyl-3-methyl-5-hydroxy-6-metoxy-1,4-benzoquinol methylase